MLNGNSSKSAIVVGDAVVSSRGAGVGEGDDKLDGKCAGGPPKLSSSEDMILLF